MRNIFTIYLIFITSLCLVQNPWESWDKNYPLVRYAEIIKSENSSTITVEQNPKISQYFSRLDK